MAEIRNIDLGAILGTAEGIKSQRQANVAAEQQNRLDAILNPMKVASAERQQGYEIRDEDVAQAEYFTTMFGDIDPESMEAAQRYDSVRGQMIRMGVPEAETLPEQYDVQTFNNIKRLAQLGKKDEKARVGSQEILADGTIIQSTSQGPKVFSPSGQLLEGQAAVEQVRNARQFEVENQQAIFAGRRLGALGADIELGGQAAGAKAGGKFDVEESRKIGLESFNNARAIRSSLSLYDDAIQAIDNGANTGAIASVFPTIQSESKRLENIQNRLGLSIIQSTTFGALSESEMRLAMETAVPTGLDEQELKVWLQEKKNAQMKAAEALENASAQLLSGEKTLADLAKEQASKQPKAGRFKIEVIE